MLDTSAARFHFSKAAAHYDDSAIIQREIANRLLERLAILTLQPQRIMDIGCGTGYSLPTLHTRYPNAEILALDFALPMLKMAQERVYPKESLLKGLASKAREALWPKKDPFIWVSGDMVQLPIQTGSMQLLHSCLALQWGQHRLPELFAEWHRVLHVEGVLFFATLGPDTLKELRLAFAPIENAPHIHSFVDMHDIGDELVHAGFSDPVMEMETITVQYSQPMDVFKDLKGIGAVNANTLRSRGLMGKERWKRLCTAWKNTQQEGVWPVTYEVIYGHAWKMSPTLPEGYSPIKMPSRS